MKQDNGRRSVSQMFEPANPYALGTDHDYGRLPKEDLLKKEKVGKPSIMWAEKH